MIPLWETVPVEARAEGDLMGSGTTGTRPMWFALGGYVLLFAVKLGAFFFTHAGVMFAEAMHSMADTLIAGFLLVAAYMSQRPADEHYRFGYGRAQNIAALVAATIFISFTSLETLREAIPKLFEPSSTEFSNPALAIGVLVLSLAVSAIPLVQILRSKERGAAQRAQLIESINDEVALGAALIGILLLSSGVAIADPIASCLVAIVIAVNAAVLWRENAASLMGKSPDETFFEMVHETAHSVPGVVGLHGVIAEETGEQIHLGLHLEVTSGIPVDEASRIADDVCARLESKVEHLYCVVHVDTSAVEEASQSAGTAASCG